MQSGLERQSAEAARHRGPSLVAVAVVYAILAVAAVVAPTAIAGWRHFPSPFEPVASRWFVEHPNATLMSSFLLFCSALPLGIFTATASSRLQFLGMKVAGIHIALFGGVVSSVALATSAFAQWALSDPGISNSGGVVRMLHLFSFAAGGPGFVVPFGLLVAGISLVAGLQGFMPRWLMSAGLVLAAIAELSVFALVWPAAAILLPVARFSGLLWTIGVAAVLPRSREGRRRPAPSVPTTAIRPDAVRASEG
jgi:hypothetical protein